MLGIATDDTVQSILDNLLGGKTTPMGGAAGLTSTPTFPNVGKPIQSSPTLMPNGVTASQGALPVTGLPGSTPLPTSPAPTPPAAGAPAPTAPSTAPAGTAPGGDLQSQLDDAYAKYTAAETKAAQPMSVGRRNTAIGLAIASLLFGGSRFGNAAGAAAAGAERGWQNEQQQRNVEAAQAAAAYDNIVKAETAQANADYHKQMADNAAQRTKDEHAYQMGELSHQAAVLGLDQKKLTSLQNYRDQVLGYDFYRTNVSASNAQLRATVSLKIAAAANAIRLQGFANTLEGHEIAGQFGNIRTSLAGELHSIGADLTMTDQQKDAATAAAMQKADSATSALLNKIPAQYTYGGVPYSSLSGLGQEGYAGVSFNYDNAAAGLAPQDANAPAAPGYPLGGYQIPPAPQGGWQTGPGQAGAPTNQEANGLPGWYTQDPYAQDTQKHTAAANVANPPNALPPPLFATVLSGIATHAKDFPSIEALDQSLQYTAGQRGATLTPQQIHQAHEEWYKATGTPIPGSHTAAAPGASPEAPPSTSAINAGGGPQDTSDPAYQKFLKVYNAVATANPRLPQPTIAAIAQVQSGYTGPVTGPGGMFGAITRPLGAIGGAISHFFQGDPQTAATQLRQAGLPSSLIVRVLAQQFQISPKEALQAYYAGLKGGASGGWTPDTPPDESDVTKPTATKKPGVIEKTSERVPHGASTPSPAPTPQSFSGPGFYQRFIPYAAEKAGIPPALIMAVIQHESGGNKEALSKAGAGGLMQLMPGTARSHGVVDVNDPIQNITGGAAFLRELMDKYHGNIRLVAAAYNAGPGAVDRYHGVPPYPETIQYVRNVLQSYQQYQQALSTPFNLSVKF